MFVVGPGFVIDIWQTRYVDIKVNVLLSRPVIVMYDHRPSPFGSLPPYAIDAYLPGTQHQQEASPA